MRRSTEIRSGETSRGREKERDREKKKAVAFVRQLTKKERRNSEETTETHLPWISTKKKADSVK
jgi:hypothetical protein